MTIVIARRVENVIFITSDTKITDGSSLIPAIPGQLKIITINAKLTICYAGHAYTSITSIRKCKLMADSGECIDSIKSYLKKQSREFDCDFIIASHYREAELIKISSGKISKNLTDAWIGNAEVADLIYKMENDNRLIKISSQSYVQIEPEKGYEIYHYTSDLSMAFMMALIGPDELPRDIGGFPIACIAGPRGHFYARESGTIDTCTIEINQNSTKTDKHTNFGGQSTYSYSIVVGDFRGVGVVAAHIGEAGVGYIFDPLVSDEVVKVDSPDQNALWDRLLERSKNRGGIPESEII